MPAFNAYSDSHIELNDLSYFKALSSPDGYVSICGFGSLLSEKSARSTFFEVKNFRVRVLSGFRRLYAAVGSVFVQLGLANQETGEVSGLTVEPCHGETLIVTVFEIRLEEVGLQWRFINNGRCTHLSCKNEFKGLSEVGCKQRSMNESIASL